MLLVLIGVGSGWLLWSPAPPRPAAIPSAVTPAPPASTSNEPSGDVPAGVTAPVTLVPQAPSPVVSAPGAGPPGVSVPIVPLTISPVPATPAATTPPAPNEPAVAPDRSAVATVSPPDGTVAAPDPARSPPPAPINQPYFSISIATEQQILDHIPVAGAAEPTIFRFSANPRILVLDFASLLDQGRMLNRVAALVEKAGLPRDRLLTDDELDRAVSAGGDTVETYYYGHDYGVSSLLRFFALGDRDNVRLVGEEDTLRRLIRQEGWFAPDIQAALISIPQVGADQHITRSGRAIILHHELSHGEYFTDPTYAAFVHRFWTQTLTTTERDRFRRHLRSLGYDSGLAEVMENEAQAYLMFTGEGDFFRPDMIGMSQIRLDELRNGFYRAMPPGWLRDSLGKTLSHH